MHETAKNFKCKFWEKLFKAQTHLQQHEKTHENDATVNCPTCFKLIKKKRFADALQNFNKMSSISFKTFTKFTLVTVSNTWIWFIIIIVANFSKREEKIYNFWYFSFEKSFWFLYFIQLHSISCPTTSQLFSHVVLHAFQWLSPTFLAISSVFNHVFQAKRCCETESKWKFSKFIVS